MTKQAILRFYLVIASALALLRTVLFFYISYRMSSHTVTLAVRSLDFVFYPELSLWIATPLSGIRNHQLYSAAFIAFFGVGSFIVTSPILLLRLLVNPAYARG